MKPIWNKNGWLLGLFSIVVFSAGTPFTRGAMVAGMAPETLITFRFVLAAILFTAMGAATGMFRLKDGDISVFKQGGLWKTLVAGILQSIALLAFYRGVTTVEASIASMSAAAIYSITILVANAMMGSRLTPQTVLRLFIGLIGLLFLLGVGSGGEVDPVGMMLVATSALTYGLYLVWIQHQLSAYNSNTVSTGVLWLVVIGIGGYWITQGADLYIPGMVGWTAIFAQAILVSVVGTAAMFASIKMIGSSEYTLMAPLETLLTTVWAVFFLNEMLTIPQFIGAMLVVLSLVLAGKKIGAFLDARLMPRRVRPATAASSI